MVKERGDPQGSYGLSRSQIDMLVVMVDVPDDIGVGNKIDLTVIECRDTGKDNRRTVGLDGLAFEVIVNVRNEICDRDLLVGIIAHEVDCCERDELDFGMCC